MGELRLSGYLAHETRVLQDNMRIFDPSQAEPAYIPFIFFLSLQQVMTAVPPKD